jgi:hypothetical protein
MSHHNSFLPEQLPFVSPEDKLGLFDAHDKSPQVGFRPAFLGGYRGSGRPILTFVGRVLFGAISARDGPAGEVPRPVPTRARIVRLGSFCMIRSGQLGLFGATGPGLFVGWASPPDTFQGAIGFVWHDRYSLVPAQRVANWVRFAQFARPTGFVCTTGSERVAAPGAGPGEDPAAVLPAGNWLCLYDARSTRPARPHPARFAGNWLCFACVSMSSPSAFKSSITNPRGVPLPMGRVAGICAEKWVAPPSEIALSLCPAANKENLLTGLF